ncbi:MAG: hypothetical protein MZW92_03310 [Comamonadaceae bacterium]|nr:hypothetical protein [Comamonadaceae bacterium]
MDGDLPDGDIDRIVLIGRGVGQAQGEPACVTADTAGGEARGQDGQGRENLEFGNGRSSQHNLLPISFSPYQQMIIVVPFGGGVSSRGLKMLPIGHAFLSKRREKAFSRSEAEFLLELGVDLRGRPAIDPFGAGGILDSGGRRAAPCGS